MKNIIILGTPRIGKVFAHELLSKNQSIIYDREIKNLENAGITNAKEAFEMSIQVFNHEDLSEALKHMAIAAKNMGSSSDELKDIHVRFKQNEPFEEPKSRYINKPRYNFKRR